MNINKLKSEIFSIQRADFNDTALAVFQYQLLSLPIYKKYIDLLHIDLDAIHHFSQIPFLPISFFKTHAIKDEIFQSSPLTIFESSTTTGAVPSKHFVLDTDLYENSFMRGFNIFFGDITDYCILGLLPSYLERGQSSLVYMVNEMIQLTNHPLSGFYLHEQEQLFETLQQLEKQKQKTLLFGVTYALLDFAEKYSMPMEHIRIIETGGMKGRRTDIDRTTVHDILKKSFRLPHIFSEYGMTELLSQAYSLENEIFHTPHWMKVLVRDINDPMSVTEKGRGALNIIDLANIHACSFIATEDVGDVFEDSSFKVLGRMDQRELRGCSLLTV